MRKEGIVVLMSGDWNEAQRAWAVAQAETSGYRSVGVYSGALGWGYNTEIFESRGLKAPACWADLLKPEYKNRVALNGSPLTSGSAVAGGV